MYRGKTTTGREASEILARVLAAVVKLGFPTAGMVAYEADLPAHEALAAPPGAGD